MTTTLAAAFAADGFVVQSGLLTPAQVEALRDDAIRLCMDHGKTLGGESASADMKSILGIHFPHKLSTLMLRTLSLPSVVSVLTQLIGPNVKCMQSMLLMKAAGKPGQAWHQDEAFIPTRDRSLTAAWIALDNATVGNGCLWVAPGSHSFGVIWPQRSHEDPEFDPTIASYGFPDTLAAIPLEVAAGDVIFLDGYLLHKSHRNRCADGFRRALVNHYMRAESLLPWNVGGREDNRDVVLVAGSDPYAWKGTEERNAPHIRNDAR
jgi:hypothetical protein